MSKFGKNKHSVRGSPTDAKFTTACYAYLYNNIKKGVSSVTSCSLTSSEQSTIAIVCVFLSKEANIKKNCQIKMVQLTGKYKRTSEARYEEILNKLGCGKDY